MKKHYLIKKDNKLVYIKYEDLTGFTFTPKTFIFVDDGVLVAKIVIFKPEFIELVLKKKIKNKLNLYLNLILSDIDDASGDSTYVKTLYADIARYRMLLLNRYKRYLPDSYVELLLRKISIIEEEIKLRLDYQYENVREGKTR